MELDYDNVISNKFSISQFFAKYSLQTDRRYLLQIREYDSFCRVEIDSKSICYHLHPHEFVEYILSINYDGRTIRTISEYVFSYHTVANNLYSERIQIFQYKESPYIQKHRNLIKLQLQNYFYKIQSGLNLYDIETDPWYYNEIQSFQQFARLKTTSYIRNFILRLRKNIQSQRHFQKQLLKFFFHAWKEWYYNPFNNNGYIKKLKTLYH
jgi:hypothetical protein